MVLGTLPKADHAQMPDIMSSLMFQNSRRQLLAYLIHACNAAPEHRGEHLGKEPEHDVQGRRVESLKKAVRAADEQVKSLEYWSDVKTMTGSEEGREAGDQCDNRLDSQKAVSTDTEGSENPVVRESNTQDMKELRDNPDEESEQHVNHASDETEEKVASGTLD